MKCDIKIMASPRRYGSVLNICKILNLDVEKDVFFDDRPNGGDAAYTSERTWDLPFEDDSITHRCVLQDDVLLCRGFKDALAKLIERFPNDVFSLFCPSAKMVDLCEKYDIPQIVEIRKCGVYGPAVVMPREYIAFMYAWGREIANGCKIVHDDVLIGEYALAHNMKVYTTIPSLIQHAQPTNSLLGYGRESKVSKVFDMDAGKLDWANARTDAKITIPNSMKFYKKG